MDNPRKVGDDVYIEPAKAWRRCLTEAVSRVRVLVWQLVGGLGGAAVGEGQHAHLAEEACAQRLRAIEEGHTAEHYGASSSGSRDRIGSLGELLMRLAAWVLVPGSRPLPGPSHVGNAPAPAPTGRGGGRSQSAPWPLV
jgi:hypothetical protein